VVFQKILAFFISENLPLAEKWNSWICGLHPASGIRFEIRRGTTNIVLVKAYNKANQQNLYRILVKLLRAKTALWFLSTNVTPVRWRIGVQLYMFHQFLQRTSLDARFVSSRPLFVTSLFLLVWSFVASLLKYVERWRFVVAKQALEC